MINTSLLKQHIENTGLKRKYIADRLGLTSYGLAKKVDNRNEFKASEISKLCEILSLTASEREEVFFANDVD